jgi:Mg-chelatase subunit ChlD
MKNNSRGKNGFRKRTVHNLIILDESGSMESIKHATISGFNELVQTIKGVGREFPEQRHYVSLVTFNGLGIKTRLFVEKVETLREIDERSFRPDSMTPLYDAIGFSARKLRREIEGVKNCSVLVTILTDGLENNSREYTGRDIRALITELKQEGWTFTYMGANHDVGEIAYSLAIPNKLQFEANERDLKRAFDADKSARVLYALKMRRGEDLQENYFEDAGEEKSE